MLVVKLMGGLGNQMFQYAFTKNLAEKNNIQFKIDLSFLKRRDLGSNFVYRDFDLDIFNLEVSSEINPIDLENQIKIIENFFHYNSEIEQQIFNSKLKNFYLEGYWQSPKYFQNITEDLKKDFTFKNPIENINDDKIKVLLDDILSSNSVMVNIRRTDYLNTNFHGIMDINYFDSAKKIIESKIENPKYFIFSDDIDWCIDNIKFENQVIVNHNYKGYKFGTYLQLMKNCKNFIIPNSTFAWWSAWLCDNQNKNVVCPKKWFNDSKINTDDLIPSDWIKI